MSCSRTTHSTYQFDDLTMLRNEHQTLENRLLELDRDPALSPEEKYEAQLIKKRTLFIKDRIHSLELLD